MHKLNKISTDHWNKLTLHLKNLNIKSKIPKLCTCECISVCLYNQFFFCTHQQRWGPIPPLPSDFLSKKEKHWNVTVFGFLDYQKYECHPIKVCYSVFHNQNDKKAKKMSFGGIYFPLVLDSKWWAVWRYKVSNGRGLKRMEWVWSSYGETKGQLLQYAVLRFRVCQWLSPPSMSECLCSFMKWY